MTDIALPHLYSWHDFLAAAQEPETIFGEGRHARDSWCGGSWEDALRLAVDGWSVPLLDTHVSVAALRERAGLGASVTTLEPAWDVTGSEVDIGAYLAGVPECMVDAVPRQTSRRGRIVAFLVPAAYASRTPHRLITNRGIALATLCSAIIAAGHSVEIWSGFVGLIDHHRIHAAARVVSAGEPLDLGRLIFAVAHPLMLRRLWFAVWDAQHPDLASWVRDERYGVPSHCLAEDLPEEVTDPYVFPYLQPGDPQWTDMDTALDWCHGMFTDLGLLE